MFDINPPPTSGRHLIITNFCAFHFVSIPVVSIVKLPAAGNAIRSIHSNVVGNKVVFTVERASDKPVDITIYNIAGKRVVSLTSTSANGRSALEWDSKMVGKGIYYYRALVGGAVVNGKIGL